MSRRVLAKRIGARGESYVAALELNQIRRGSRLHLVAEALLVTVTWLETGKEPKRLSYRNSKAGAAAEVAEPKPTEAKWLAYLRAPASTRAVIDLLLLPPRERAACLADHELVRHCIEQLERLSPKLIGSAKSA